MKSLIVINFNNQNPFNFDLDNFEFDVKQFNYETHQVGKYYNKFEEEVLDELKRSDYVLVNGRYINGDVLNNIQKICNNNTVLFYPYLKIDLLNSSYTTDCYLNNNSSNLINSFSSGVLKNIRLFAEVKSSFMNTNETMHIDLNTKPFSTLFTEGYSFFRNIENKNINIDKYFFDKISDNILLKNNENNINKPCFFLGQGCSNGSNSHDYYQLHNGKVRDLYRVGINRLMIKTTNRVSAYDNVCGSINSKGRILNNICGYNFKQTADLVPNHYLYHENEYMIVRECIPIKLEVIVRQYLTGSLWSLYKNKGAEYVNNLYGINLVEGLQKNQKLNELIVTPTTKDEHDLPINPRVFTNEKSDNFIVNKKDWEIIKNYALTLFNSGSNMFSDVDLLLVDTKYEFGRDLDTGKIILIDELHTPDSSRFWNKNTYNENYYNGKDPECYDKQFFRNWLVESGNKESICNSSENVFDLEIPEDIRRMFINHYDFIYRKICTESEYQRIHLCSHSVNEYKVINDILNKFYMEYDDKTIVVCAGSTSDREWIQKIGENVNKVGLNCIVLYGSAHKNTSFVLDKLNTLYKQNRKRRLVFVTVAGRSNALSGVVACNVPSPVIACPPFKDKDDMMVNINSTLVMPSDVPTMTILEPRNVALSAKRIFNNM